MLKKDIILKKNIELDNFYKNIESKNFNHALIEDINNIGIKGKIKYQESLKAININAIITCDLKLIDARDGKVVDIKKEEFVWDDEYFFESAINDQANIVFGESFNILEYAIEQIVLNIPMNFTINYGKISFVGKDFTLISEEEYQQEQENKEDPRWDKLKEFKFKNQ
ncbi:hypothetical protein SGLAD_v1c07630 [Spiroplasma gladiatoris]|uniref:DUF177 domain-containing protein n=1 Tax=Spiroplasma gladiatoris TaxID=2143 RepID=A0A4P7AI83_9MOLU|nr:YceD family protein [Spiroplasma gladiatoris]QBQ07962.1 hypothetical protein SGLAD_v1c07630 [Spiroplasma gladiatoris]